LKNSILATLIYQYFADRKIFLANKKRVDTRVNNKFAYVSNLCFQYVKCYLFLIQIGTPELAINIDVFDDIYAFYPYASKKRQYLQLLSLYLCFYITTLIQNGF